MESQFKVIRRNVGHWDIITGGGDRAFRIRGGPGHYMVIDERQKHLSDKPVIPFKTVGSCMVYICDELMYQLVIADGQTPTVIEAWNIP
jgi:hypothetical protein